MTEPRRVLITGSDGLVGRTLSRILDELNYEIVGLDVSPDHRGVRDIDRLRQAADGCVGIVHLAAQTRIEPAEADPAYCWDLNAGGTANVLHVAATAKSDWKPWVLFTSSREVYGQPTKFPVTEDAPIRPVNTYGSSKATAETLVTAFETQFPVGIVRLSNVYGDPVDHVDRVVPAFVRAALAGKPLRVDGANTSFDFVHVGDAVAGLINMIDILEQGYSVRPVHLTTGICTTLFDLASLVIEIAGSPSIITYERPRPIGPVQFVGDPTRALKTLGWKATVTLHDGVSAMIQSMREELRK